jgi:lon-related putative ATP-dependent protease
MTGYPSPLPPEQLYRHCDPADFPFVDTAELPDIDLAMGQSRALEALRFGLKMTRAGFNIFALGPAGLGKTTAIREIVGREALLHPAPDDWCYVNNFADPAKPRTMRLPPGWGKRLSGDIDRLIAILCAEVPAAYEQEDYRSRAEAIEDAGKNREAAAINDLRIEARQQQIALIETPSGFAFAPLDENTEVMSPDAFHQLPEERRRAMQAAIGEFHERLQRLLQQFPAWRRETRQRLQDLKQATAAHLITQHTDALKPTYQSVPVIIQHLDALRLMMIERADEFLPREEEGMAALLGQIPSINRYQHYRINLLVDNGETQGAPLVFESLPHHANLVGRVEHQAHLGTLVTDFTRIRAGSLHRANGGYLVLDALKLLTQPFAWDTLKRALQSGEIRIEPLERTLSLISTTALEPEPIPLRLKIVLIGDRLLYYLLCHLDPEFRALFKVPADFDDTVTRDREGSLQLARCIASLARRNGLRPLDREAVMRVIEQTSRVVEDAEKLGTHLGPLADLLKEADHWAGEAGHATIVRDDIQTAIDRQIRRASRIRDAIQEEIRRGTLLIDTQGRAIGQVNGLSVVALGEYRFGHPVRITATTRLGSGKIVDIERETELGGSLHSKGVMILSAFLASRYARRQPLTLAASLVFEQSYGEVEGDSASLAELCALLSSLSSLPVRQDLAVTGSVNQLGRVQPIGGVNEKIEGFFDVCAQAGLSGQQGVIIPRANVPHLMLREDLVQQAANGDFRIHAVSTVDEALALLLDTAAGERDASGAFPPGTVNARVEQTLGEWTLIACQFNQTSSNGG